MRRILIILLTIHCSLFTVHCSAKLQGQAQIDSLLKELPRQKEDTNKVKLLNVLSFGYYIISPGEGIKYGQQSVDLATKLGWKKGLAPAYIILGTNYVSKSDFPKALEYEFKSLKLYEEMGNKNGIANVTGNIGIIYASMTDYPKALEYFLKALKLDEGGGYKSYAAGVTTNIANIYSDQKDYPKALEYYLKALKLAEELGNKDGIAFITQDIGVMYVQQKKYIMAVEYYQRALKMNEELGNTQSTATNLSNIGGAYILITKDTAAKGGIVTNATELPESKHAPTVPIPKGKAALLAAATDYLQRSLVLCKKTQFLNLMTDCYSNLSEAYKLKGDYKKAMEYEDSLKVINKSVFSQENQETIAKLENARKQFADSLNAAEAKKMADVKAAHRRNYELIGGGVIVLLLGFTFLLRKNNKLLDKEKKQSDNLLLNILPEEVASQLKDTGKSAARQFDNVSVLFTDFVNFTEASERMTPEALIEELDTCFKAFDDITSKYNVEKIKTIGDAYLAVCGLPIPDPKHAENVLRAAVDINAYMADRLAKLGSERTFAVRIGIHSGSVVAGIVGVKKFAYDIWGDTVNTAARMEQNSEAGKINISETTYELVKDKFSCEYRGEVEAKGKGVMKMYFVV